MGSIQFDGDDIIFRIRKPHPQVLPFFPQYDINKHADNIILDYGNPLNCCGHQQRAWLTYWFLRAFAESDGMVGLDLGSAGVQHPGSLSVDAIGTGETPEYGGVMSGVQIKANADDLHLFGSDSFSCVLSNHLIEHIPCLNYPNASLQERRWRQCDGQDLIATLRCWLRVVRPGGYVGFITPDNDIAIRNRMTTFDYDQTHQHALGGRDFCALVAQEMDHEIEAIEANTLNNNFSFQWIGRKR